VGEVNTQPGPRLQNQRIPVWVWVLGAAAALALAVWLGS